MRAFLLALVVLALWPAAAHATSFRGITQQDQPVTLDADTEGETDRIELIWRARCRSGFKARLQDADFVSADGEASAAVVGTSRYKFPDRRGRLAQVTMRLSGRLSGSPLAPAEQVWRGTFRATVVMRRHGRVVDRCGLRTSWIARPEGIGEGTWSMTGGGDWVGSDRVWNYDRTNAVISAVGERTNVNVEVDAHDGTSWSARFTAPALNRLTPGQRYTTDSATPGAADFDVSGDGRGCTSSGSFTILAIGFDRLRRLTHLKVEFEQFCDSANEGPSRGTIEWRITR
ncbi:MAG TPA: hypothetical protein VGW10_00010 [Solirubrobacteraceae bacterium]|nr:hypothetical protein [Solirubrobacteraceae bacterium]